MRMYQVDAFSPVLFQGNPAAVIVLQQWLSDTVMQQIAAENNLAETAFVKIIDAVNYEIRWFSPKVEVAFCGHATLASAYVLFKDYSQASQLQFHVKDLGVFTVQQAADGRIDMDFPIRQAEVLLDYPAQIHQAIDREILGVYINAQAYILLCASAQDVRDATPNFELIAALAQQQHCHTAITGSTTSEHLDVAITAAVSDTDHTAYDYVARYFAPHIGIHEDPVTGSLHTALAPFWAERLGKTALCAYQASARGGTLYCEILNAQRVQISGYACLYMQAELNI
ncbi:PhzF family phenazine biosynthesis protein [Acinetobacter larvae]|uniref:Phenazine biosynthesis protein PhzF n=1 Tax=Acinetobacter larvae TaxID=1789224 RepID=A0A1B2M1C1_9GAMM|nr:PhzF family phenazine biosynthesis protein [Acinetobacter larvae]AOA58951.1 phenazine biosynthesis protein PhzF [Acinetobacter larvae]